MKKGSYYFGLLTKEEQRNYRLACKEQGKDFEKRMIDSYFNFNNFIVYSFGWRKTKQGHVYWREIANSNRTEKPKDTRKANFKILIYSILIGLSLVAVCALFYNSGYNDGYNKGKVEGFNKGADFGTREIQNLFGYDKPKAESVEQYERMIKNRKL